MLFATTSVSFFLKSFSQRTNESWKDIFEKHLNLFNIPTQKNNTYLIYSIWVQKCHICSAWNAFDLFKAHEQSLYLGSDSDKDEV